MSLTWYVQTSPKDAWLLFEVSLHQVRTLPDVAMNPCYLYFPPGPCYSSQDDSG